MSTTLLSMINNVRGKLREERIGSINANDILTTELIDLLNDAGSDILNGAEWSFDVRTDGRTYFPGRKDGASFTDTDATIWESTTAGTVVTLGVTISDDDLFAFRFTDPRRARIVVDSAADKANTSFIVSSINSLAPGNLYVTLTFANPRNIAVESASGEYLLFANEAVLPSTVREVLHARNEEQNLHVEFSTDEDMPVRTFDAFSDSTESIVVGGTITSTARTGTWPNIAAAAATTGTRIMVWPPPLNDTQIHYSYRVRHSDLSAATDEWANVPQHVTRIIEWRALQYAYQSGIQNDPVRGREAALQVERRLARALAQDDAQPNRRRVPTSFGYEARGNPRRRWASQTITAP